MKIEILNSDENHPVNCYLKQFKSDMIGQHSVSILRTESQLTDGNLLFLISCNEKVSNNALKKFNHSMVIHASDLPLGRGWSPHIWEIISGARYITVSLIAAGEEIDAGGIYAKRTIDIPKTALWDQINHLLFRAELDLMKFAVENFENLFATPQDLTINPTYYRRRAPKDSEIDISLPLVEQFDLLRVCDPNRFPAFFSLNNTKYKIVIEKM